MNKLLNIMYFRTNFQVLFILLENTWCKLAQQHSQPAGLKCGVLVSGSVGAVLNAEPKRKGK